MNTWNKLGGVSRVELHISFLCIIFMLFFVACNNAGSGNSGNDNNNSNIQPAGVSGEIVSGSTVNSSDFSNSDISGNNNEQTMLPSENDGSSDNIANAEDGSPQSTGQEVSQVTSNTVVYRDNTPCVYTVSSPGTVCYGNELVNIDASNSSQGYITVQYLGSNSKVKFQLTGSDGVTYTYDIDNSIAVLPLTGGNGTYSAGCYENISGTDYSVAYTGSFDVAISDSISQYLYPNQYVNFNSSSNVVSTASSLVSQCENDLQALETIYDYAVNNITYDYNKATTVQSGYIPVPDNTLASGTGICFDYAVLVASMLRSQRIPTKLEIGYAGGAYHAWISVYLKETGWIDGIMYFDGTSWVLMDPTFAANSDIDAFSAFIGNGSNYVTVYKY